MKHLLLVLAIIGLSTTSMASGADTHFICGYSQSYNDLSIQFDGPRFGDAVSLGLTNQELQELLFDDEKGIEAPTGKMNGFLTFGSCQKGSFNTLVSCKEDKAILNYSFTFTEELAKDYSQTVTYNRRLKISDFSLVVKNVDGFAHLDLKMTFSHLTAKDAKMHISRNLGKIDNGPGSCRFTSRL